jgi:hypothetical protein
MPIKKDLQLVTDDEREQLSTAETRRLYQRRYYHLHKEKAKEYQRQYNLTHKKKGQKKTDDVPREAVQESMTQTDWQHLPVEISFAFLTKVLRGKRTLTR